MLILIGDRILLTNLDFQLRNAKITRFWNRVCYCKILNNTSNTTKPDILKKINHTVIVSNGGLKMDEKIAPHLEELTRALGDLEKTGIRAEFEKLLAFRVPPEVAKESILRKFGGKNKVLKVKDLSGNLKSFEITGRVLDLGEKSIRPQDGAQEGPSKLYTGILADETGSVMFSSWKELPGSTGDVINIRNAYTRIWQNRIRLS